MEGQWKFLGVSLTGISWGGDGGGGGAKQKNCGGMDIFWKYTMQLKLTLPGSPAPPGGPIGPGSPVDPFGPGGLAGPCGP